ncbi:hypothetical protein Ae150APs1_5415 [Pseudonocardia sp. Ae150A_Ps1]|nr:hypothetical protein Ae150APs1_5415 [Pseudonocardia sp. Ae150A_Ps1]
MIDLASAVSRTGVAGVCMSRPSSSPASPVDAPTPIGPPSALVAVLAAAGIVVSLQ